MEAFQVGDLVESENSPDLKGVVVAVGAYGDLIYVASVDSSIAENTIVDSTPVTCYDVYHFKKVTRLNESKLGELSSVLPHVYAQLTNPHTRWLVPEPEEMYTVLIDQDGVDWVKVSNDAWYSHERKEERTWLELKTILGTSTITWLMEG